MALNFSHHLIFPAHSPDECIVGHGGSQDKDIRDILPADPFGMDISSTVTAITEWLEDLAVSDYSVCQGGRVGIGKAQYPIVAGWNFWWDTAVEFRPLLGHKKKDDKFFRNIQFDEIVPEEVLGCFVDDDGGHGDCFMEDVNFGRSDVRVQGNKFDLVHKNTEDNVFSSDMSNEFFVEGISEQFDDVVGVSYEHGTREEEAVIFDDDNVYGIVNGHKICEAIPDGDDGSPHPALSFALAYLGVRDLLNVERVCKSMLCTVQNDPLLWKNIHIDNPLNERITDDGLLKLVSRAQGHLQCLSLVECKITNDCLRRILESNPSLIKLSVPGCAKLSIDGVVRCLKALQIGAETGLKHLRLGGLGGFWKETSEHFQRFEELQILLGTQNHMQIKDYQPHFYRKGNLYLSSDDDRPLDIEICSKCKNLRLVYDCPAESCQTKDQLGQRCRACILCISRCVHCGRCINDVVYEETFFLELECSNCLRDSKC